MGIQEYVGSDETVLAQAVVHSDPYAVVFSGKAGEIACTPSRLIYSERKKTVDIPVNEVGSMEFEGPRMPRAYLYTGIAALLFAIFGDGLSSGLQSFCYVLGPVLLGLDTCIEQVSSRFSHRVGPMSSNLETDRSRKSCQRSVTGQMSASALKPNISRQNRQRAAT